MKSSLGLGSRPHVGRPDGAMVPEILFALRNRSFRTTGMKPAARRCFSLWRPPRWRFARRGLHPRYRSIPCSPPRSITGANAAPDIAPELLWGRANGRGSETEQLPHMAVIGGPLIQNKVTVRSVDYSRSNMSVSTKLRGMQDPRRADVQDYHRSEEHITNYRRRFRARNVYFDAPRPSSTFQDTASWWVGYGRRKSGPLPRSPCLVKDRS